MFHWMLIFYFVYYHRHIGFRWFFRYSGKTCWKNDIWHICHSIELQSNVVYAA